MKRAISEPDSVLNKRTRSLVIQVSPSAKRWITAGDLISRRSCKIRILNPHAAPASCHTCEQILVILHKEIEAPFSSFSDELVSACKRHSPKRPCPQLLLQLEKEPQLLELCTPDRLYELGLTDLLCASMDLPSQMEAIHSDDDLVGLITAECDHRVLRNIKSRSKSETKASKTSTMNQKKKKTEPVYEQTIPSLLDLVAAAVAHELSAQSADIATQRRAAEIFLAPLPPEMQEKVLQHVSESDYAVFEFALRSGCISNQLVNFRKMVQAIHSHEACVWKEYGYDDGLKPRALLDVFACAASFTHPPAIDPIESDCMFQQSRPLSGASIVSEKEFLRNFEAFSTRQLEGFDLSNCLIIGGSVLASLLPLKDTGSASDSYEALRDRYLHEYPTSDIDIFCYDMEPEDFRQKLLLLKKHLCLLHGADKVITVQSTGAFTFCAPYPHRHIQIVNGMWDSQTHILLGADIDCTKLGFDGERIYGMPLTRLSLNYRINLVNAKKWWIRGCPGYEERLLKFSQRGFRVLDLELRRAKLKPKRLTSPEVWRRRVGYTADGEEREWPSDDHGEQIFQATVPNVWGAKFLLMCDSNATFLQSVQAELALRATRSIPFGPDVNIEEAVLEAASWIDGYRNEKSTKVIDLDLPDSEKGSLVARWRMPRGGDSSQVYSTPSPSFWWKEIYGGPLQDGHKGELKILRTAKLLALNSKALVDQVAQYGLPIPEAILANLSKEILSAVVDEKYGAIRFAFAVTTRREVDLPEHSVQFHQCRGFVPSPKKHHYINTKLISAAEEDDLVMDGIHSENQLELLAHMGSRAAKSQKPGHVVRVLLTPTNESIALIPRINDIQGISLCGFSLRDDDWRSVDPAFLLGVGIKAKPLTLTVACSAEQVAEVRTKFPKEEFEVNFVVEFVEVEDEEKEDSEGSAEEDEEEEGSSSGK